MNGGFKECLKQQKKKKKHLKKLPECLSSYDIPDILPEIKFSKQNEKKRKEML